MTLLTFDYIFSYCLTTHLGMNLALGRQTVFVNVQSDDFVLLALTEYWAHR